MTRAITLLLVTVLALCGAGYVVAQSQSEVNTLDLNQIQRGDADGTQKFNIGNVSESGQTNVNVGNVTQTQGGQNNKQTLNVGNVKGGGKANVIVKGNITQTQDGNSNSTQKLNIGNVGEVEEDEARSGSGNSGGTLPGSGSGSAPIPAGAGRVPSSSILLTSTPSNKACRGSEIPTSTHCVPFLCSLSHLFRDSKPDNCELPKCSLGEIRSSSGGCEIDSQNTYTYPQPQNYLAPPPCRQFEGEKILNDGDCQVDKSFKCSPGQERVQPWFRCETIACRSKETRDKYGVCKEEPTIVEERISPRWLPRWSGLELSCRAAGGVNLCYHTEMFVLRPICNPGEDPNEIHCIKTVDGQDRISAFLNENARQIEADVAVIRASEKIVGSPPSWLPNPMGDLARGLAGGLTREAGEARVLLYFFELEKSNTPLDVKNQPDWQYKGPRKWDDSKQMTEYIVYNGELWSPEELGNYILGYMGAAAGIPLDTVLKGAGAYQLVSDTMKFNPKFDRYGSNFDDPRDQENILRGYRDYSRQKPVEE